jgi:hypothetical protein
MLDPVIIIIFNIIYLFIFISAPKSIYLKFCYLLFKFCYLTYGVLLSGHWTVNR